MYEEHSKNELWGIVGQHTSTKECNVINDRYRQDMSYQEIGEKHNISKQRARQIEHEALRKLRIGKARRALLEQFDVAEYIGIVLISSKNMNLHQQ